MQVKWRAGAAKAKDKLDDMRVERWKYMGEWVIINKLPTKRQAKRKRVSKS